MQVLKQMIRKALVNGSSSRAVNHLLAYQYFTISPMSPLDQEQYERELVVNVIVELVEQNEKLKGNPRYVRI